MSEDKQMFDIGSTPSLTSKLYSVVKSHKKVIIVIAIVLAVIIGTTYALFNGKLGNLSCNVNYTSSCGLKDGAKLLAPTKSKDLSKIVTKIQKIKNYQSDPNLLYIIITYYINISDGKNASKYYTMLTKVYDPYAGFSKQLGSKVLFISQIKSTVDFLVAQSDPANLNIQSSGGATR